MKRNHTTKRVPRSGISPYVKQGKRPFDYSPLYKRFPTLKMRPALSSFGQLATAAPEQSAKPEPETRRRINRKEYHQ